jgi:hypothetical protein
MARPITAPRHGEPKQIPLRVPAPLAGSLYAYCQATGATHTNVICKAVRRLIEHEIKLNPGVREEYEQALEAWLDSARPRKGSESLRLLDLPPKKSRRGSGRGPKGPANGEDGQARRND